MLMAVNAVQLANVRKRVPVGVEESGALGLAG